MVFSGALAFGGAVTQLGDCNGGDTDITRPADVKLFENLGRPFIDEINADVPIQQIFHSKNFARRCCFLD